MARRLFGTDGVRGVAGETVSAELAVALGRIATRQAPASRPQVLVIRDTRESGEMLEAAIAAGITSAGGDVLLGGVLPTPAAALLVARYRLDLAVVLSASHNPYADNGIKFFGPDGHKLSDTAEDDIEMALSDEGARAGPVRSTGGPGGDAPPRMGRIRRLHGAEDDYLRELGVRFSGLDLGGVRVALDCANGATYRVAPEIFRRLGARVTAVSDSPDGRNINRDCGSTHVDGLAELVRGGGQDLGFAFDGDGDRVLGVDRRGEVVDGDELLALAALHLQATDRLPGIGVAVTVMTNYGFHRAMQEAGIEVTTTAVGDRYVLEALRARGWSLGGEQSGHIIEMGFAPSGDGIASALLAMEALSGRDLVDRGAMRKLPQRLVNVRVVDRQALEASDEVQDAVRREEQALQGRGRVLVRPSGTEPLVRVMVEAPSEAEADAVCARLVDIVEAALA